MSGTTALVLVLLALLAATGLVAWWAWQELGDVPLGLHGWTALGLGVAATLALGVGLMWLVFYSSRHGYDERAGRDE